MTVVNPAPGGGTSNAQTVSIGTAPPAIIAIDAPAAGGAYWGATDLTGWAADPGANSGTGIDVMHLYLDAPYPTGTFIAVLPYGNTSRPDVASYLGNSRFTSTGYSYRWDISQLSPGQHTAVVYAHSTVRGWFYVTRTFTVQ